MPGLAGKNRERHGRAIIRVRRRERGEKREVTVGILPVFEQRADHPANRVELAADEPDRLLPRAELHRIAPMLARIAIARRCAGFGPFRNKIVPRKMGGTPLPPLLARRPLAGRAQSRRAERVGQDVESGGIHGHFGSISPK
jgi:hypothetical protein